MFGLNNIKTISQQLQWNGQQFIIFCVNGCMRYLLFLMPMLINFFLSSSLAYSHSIFSLCHTNTHTRKQIHTRCRALSILFGFIIRSISRCFVPFFMKKRNKNENDKWKEKNSVFLMRDLKINHTKYQLWGAVYSLSFRVLETATLNRSRKHSHSFAHPCLCIISQACCRQHFVLSSVRVLLFKHEHG